MSKTCKFVCAFLIALLIVLASLVGFACSNYVSKNTVAIQPPERIVMASANRTLMPNVKVDTPLQDFVVPVDGLTGKWYFDYDAFVSYVDTLSAQSVFVYILTSMDFTTFEGPPVTCVVDGVSYDLAYFGFGVILGEPIVEGMDYVEDGPMYFESSFIFSSMAPIFAYENDLVNESIVPITNLPLLPSGIIVDFGSVRTKFIVSDLVAIFAQSLSTIATTLGADFSTIASALFFDGGHLSAFAIILMVFCVISLGFALTRFVMRFTSSMGSRK